jgi:DNA-binding beta-propeller fold protein YncE
VAVDAQTSRAVVTAHIPNSHGDVLGILDARSGRLLRTIPVGRDPFRVLIDPRRGRAVVANDEDGTVSVLDLRSGIVKGRTVAVGTDPVDMAVDTRTGRAIVINRGSDSVSILDEQYRAAPRTLPLGVHPQAVAVDERTGHVIIATAGGAVAEPDAWRWVPQFLRRWLPFLAAPWRHARLVPPRVIVLDESRL